jgi:hypothetical protein
LREVAMLNALVNRCELLVRKPIDVALREEEEERVQQKKIMIK